MDSSSLLPERSAEDIFAERVRFVIGDQEYALPALSIERNEAWLAAIDKQLAGVMSALEDAGDDTAAILEALKDDPGPLFELLEAYDVGHVLPKRAQLRKALTPLGLLRVVMTIWRAANPRADIIIAAYAMAFATRSRSRRRAKAAGLPTAPPS